MTQFDEAAESNEVLEKGADYEVVEWIVDDYDNPVDISGDTFRAQIREYAGAAGSPIASFTFEIFLDNNEPTPFYKYRRTMAQALINALTIKEAVWDQFQELSDGTVTKNMRGKVKIVGNVTDPTVTP